MSEFDDIRPYNDDEVRPIINRLLNDREFLDTISHLKFPKTGQFLAPMVRSFVKKRLLKEVENVHTILNFQTLIEGYLRKLLERTVTNLSISGLDNLQTGGAYLFISNHRDIAMDSAFVNWVLFHNGFTTLRIAIGDNLLTKPFASDLMRLNKSFIVNRSATAPREKLKKAKHLSKYIHRSVLVDKENVWIAQREGRAKDGVDKTNPAIISMLCLSKAKSMPLGEYVEEAKIVPVTISYEYDPCDQAKARELYETETCGNYVKEQHEDVRSIAMGITGVKGNVHVHFDKPLGNDFETVDQVTETIDSSIQSGYVLHPSNCIAYEMLFKKSPQIHVGEKNLPFLDGDWEVERQTFKERISNCNPKYLDYLLKGYANPVITKLAE